MNVEPKIGQVANACMEMFRIRADTIMETVRSPEHTEFIKMNGIDGGMLCSKRSEKARSTIVVMVSLVENLISGAFRIPDGMVDVADTSPSEMLRRLAERYGLPISVGDAVRVKFIASMKVPGRDVVPKIYFEEGSGQAIAGGFCQSMGDDRGRHFTEFAVFCAIDAAPFQRENL